MFAKLIKYLLGFSFVGAFCTLLTVILNYLFLKVLSAPLYTTYFSVYIVTIFISYYLNSRMVFKADKSILNLVLYYGVYGSGMIFGFFVLKFYEVHLDFENHILTYLVIPVTTLWNFGMSSIVFKWQKVKVSFTHTFASITSSIRSLWRKLFKCSNSEQIRS